MLTQETIFKRVLSMSTSLLLHKNIPVTVILSATGTKDCIILNATSIYWV